MPQKQQILSQLDEKMRFGAAPGCAMVVLANGKEELTYSFGCFSDGKAKVNEDTVYDIASITKLYTTAVILKLYEKGIVDINDLCLSYLPSFSDSKLKIIDLLNHRANFGIRLSEYREKYPDSFNEEVFSIKPPISPSPSVHYENITFLYLGKIIEQITNCPLARCFEALFKELDLNNTFLGNNKEKEVFKAPPTEVRGGKTIQNVTHDESAFLLGGIAGNAGIFSSARDLAKFGNAWLVGSIVSPEVLKTVVFKNYDATNLRPQGLGWSQRFMDQSYADKGLQLHLGYTGCLLALHIPTSTVCAFVSNRTYFGRNNNKHQEMQKLIIDYIIS